MSFKSLIGVAVALSLTAGAATAWGQSPVLAWKTQLGTSGEDWANGVAVDSAGNAYITGRTNGSLGGTNQGYFDAFLAKYTSTGTLAWKTQLGSSRDDEALGVAVDSAGNTYIAGYTGGSLAGTSQGGSCDAFLAKYSSTGSLAWKIQIGSSGDDYVQGVALDGAGNVYITGFTGGSLGGTNQGSYDAFLAKYSSTGSMAWKTQLGTSGDDRASGVAVDSAGNAYITGSTTGSLSGTYRGQIDAFLAKYDSAGSLSWKAQLGSRGSEYANGVAVDSAGNAYITGFTDGMLGSTNLGTYSIFLAKYSSAGSLAWQTGFGSGNDNATGVAVDSAGSAYLTGCTDNNLGGTIQGLGNLFLVKYDSAGSMAWATQFGPSGYAYDGAQGVAVDSDGESAYIAGCTTGILGGPDQGNYDASLVKYNVPEPATIALLAVGGLALIRRWRK